MIEADTDHMAEIATPTVGARAEGSVSAAMMWRYLAYQWAAAASLGLVTLIAGTAPGAKETALFAVIGVVYAFVVLMIVGGRRLPAAALQPVILLGNALITLAVYLSAESGSFYAILYVWLNVFSFNFLSRRSAAIHAALALSGYGLILLAMDGSAATFTPWLMTAGTLGFVGAMVGSLRGSIGRLIGELHDTAQRDFLTGLLNRRGCHELIELEFERARRGGRPCAIVAGDLDLFKRLNDELGHEGGDDALRQVAAILTEGKRRADSAVRMGGEEFALILPDTDRSGARALAERVRARLGDTFADEPVPLTISFGVAVFPLDGSSPDEVLRAADAALYDAKRCGRNRTVAYRADLAPSSAETTPGRDGGTRAEHSLIPG